MKVSHILAFLAILLILAAFASAAHIKFDSQYMEITLVFPENQTIEASSVPFLIEFNFDIRSSEKIEQCNLIINDYLAASSYKADTGMTNIIRHAMDTGDFRWKISCLGINGTLSESEERSLIINKKSEKPSIKIGEKQAVSPLVFFIIITLSIMIIFILYEILTSENFRLFLKRRKISKARESLRSKLDSFEKKQQEWQSTQNEDKLSSGL